MQRADAVFVGHEGDPPPVGGKGELVHVPGETVAQEAVALAEQREIRESSHLRALVGREIDPLAVAAEPRSAPAVGDRVCAGRREQRLHAGGDVGQPEVALVHRDRLVQQDRAVVWCPVERRKPAAHELDHQAIGPRIGGVHHPQVQVPTIASGGHIGVAVALV